MHQKYARLYMADSPAGIAPAPAAPSPAPEPKTGIAGMMEQLDAGVKNLEAGKPAEGTTEPAKPAAPVAEPKKPESEPIAPEPEVEPQWDKAPKNLKNAHFKFKRLTEEKIAKADARIKELESKSVQTPADLEKIKANEERITNLEKDLKEREERLIQADFRSSDTFKNNYEAKGQKAYAKAIADVKTLKVKTVDPETEQVSERPATEADFNALRRLDPYEQDKKLDELFGSSAKRVAWHIAQLNNIESEANDAIEAAREKSAEQRKLTEKQSADDKLAYDSHTKVAKEELLKTHAEYFAPDESNPEASKALAGGFDFVESALANAPKMSLKERAESSTIIHSLAAAAPRLMVEKKQLIAKVKGLEEELSKYRKSAPTKDAPMSPAAPVKDEAVGIKGMAQQFDKK